MSRRLRIWLGGALASVALAVAAWMGAGAIGAAPADLPIIRGILIALSLVLVSGVVWYLLSQAPAPPPPPTAGDDVAALLSVAEQQLAKAKVAGRRALQELPLVLVLGRPGSAKSTALTRSGLSLDLLAGDLYRGDDKVPLPTTTVNVWYTGGVGVVEVGWPVVSDGARWQRLVQRLQPKRLAAAVAGGTQAPRVVVVCLSAEELVAPDARERVQGLVRDLRAPVAALAEAFGVALPVYVLVTKADRVPGFPEFVRPFTPDEARDVVGATLPVDGTDVGGAWAERTAARIDGALTMLYTGLAARRLPVLERHPAAAQKPLAYEFPREWRKLSPALSQFLVELCRPSQLGVAPFLRGFYVTGIRPLPGEAAVAPLPAAAPAAPASATMVLTGGPPPRPAAAAAATGTRPRAQWAFLERVFGDVILADETAFGVTRSSTRVSALQRALLGGATLAMLAGIVAITASFVNNRSLAARAARHQAALAALPVVPGQPASIDALQRLDSLRALTDTVGRWVREGAPLGYRFGLFIGPSLHPALRQRYFAELRARLYDETRRGMLERLRTVDGTPRDGFVFDTTYAWLRAHLVTTTYPDSSTGAFLGPVLVRRWEAGRRFDGPRMALAQRQFEFLGDELPYGNPYADPADPAAIARARAFLLRLPLPDRVYQFILTRAGREAPPASFARTFPALTASVTAPYEVPGAFTRAGRGVVEQALGNLTPYLKGEPWVLGDNAPVVGDPSLLVDSLRARYRRDAAAEWRRYVQAASVVPFGRDAAMGRLQALAGNQSAIVAALALVARNVASDTAYLGKVFQPVFTVATADSLKPGAEGAKEYLDALSRLGADIEQVAKARGPEAADAAKAAEGTVTSARVAVTGLAQQMQVDPEGGVDRQVQRLLRQPIDFASNTLAGAGTGELNGAGASLCAAFDPLARKFPLSAFAAQEATVQELNDVLKPGSGKFWKTFAEKLEGTISRAPDGSFTAPSGGAVKIDPRFLAFLTRVGRLSDGLYANGASEPRLDFTVRPDFTKAMTQVTFTLNGRAQRFSAGSLVGSGEFTWSLGSARDARLVAQVGTRTLEIAEPGPWGLFRLFQKASTWSGRGARTIAEFTETPQGEPLPEPVRLELSLPEDAPNVLRRDFYQQGFSCVRQVAVR